MAAAGEPERAQRLCPSAPCEAGATLLGVAGPDGKLGYLTPRTTVDEDFVRSATATGGVGQRLRFASPCVEARCRHWQAGGCGVASHLGELADPRPPRARLPKCAIRPECRWFSQEGAAACAICPLVATEPRAGPAVST